MTRLVVRGRESADTWEHLTGDAAPDPLSFMQRCGIDAFELGVGVDIERFVRRYERFCQPSGAMTVDGVTGGDSIRRARRRVGRSRARSALGEAGSGSEMAGSCRYLFRSNMTSEDPAELWRHSMQPA